MLDIFYNILNYIASQLKTPSHWNTCINATKEALRQLEYSIFKRSGSLLGCYFCKFFLTVFPLRKNLPANLSKEIQNTQALWAHCPLVVKGLIKTSPPESFGQVDLIWLRSCKEITLCAYGWWDYWEQASALTVYTGQSCAKVLGGKSHKSVHWLRQTQTTAQCIARGDAGWLLWQADILLTELQRGGQIAWEDISGASPSKTLLSRTLPNHDCWRIFIASLFGREGQGFFAGLRHSAVTPLVP